ncbi:MAG: hypothetical protein U0T81_14595 [Saprospiraceae bacterium]
MLRSSRNDDPLNGVTTADIVAIQKHILGKELLNSLYRIIAADVNNTKTVTSADIAAIRKLILGVTPSFPAASSWMFIPAETTFADPTQPWNYSTEKSMTLVNNFYTQNFSSENGDVNNSSVASVGGTSKSRTKVAALKFEIAEQSS